jgi:hypothetical protein
MAQPTQGDLRTKMAKSQTDKLRDSRDFRQAARTPQRLTNSTRAPALAGGQSLRWWDRNPLARAIGAEGARQVGQSFGVSRGALHSIEGLAGGAVFAARLTHPQIDRLLSPPGMTAQDSLDHAVRGTIDYVRTATPKKVAGDIGKQFRRFRANQDPTATPQAQTLLGEMARNAELVRIKANSPLTSAQHYMAAPQTP